MADPRRRSPQRRPSKRIPLYELADVHAALGAAHGGQTPSEDLPTDTEYQERVVQIIRRGPDARWRSLLPPSAQAVSKVRALVARAPHLRELGNLVEVHLRSADTIGLPASLPPILIVGPHGIGKSWFLSRLAAAIGLPYRRYPMNGSTLGEGLHGAHPSWRNAQPGIVAKTLLSEKAANPIFFVDEADKTAPNSHNTDPFRAFYSLLDPGDSKKFTDEYLGFPMDASHAIWVMAANDSNILPPPIVDRLKIIPVQEPNEVHRAQIALSIYAEANAERRSYFEQEPGQLIVERLAGMTPRKMRLALVEAMVQASADRRCKLEVDDVVLPDPPRSRVGFCR